MILLLMLADDFTGALDTGVQFAAHGVSTRVVVGQQVDFNAPGVEVLVVDTETRHMPPEQAYGVISDLIAQARIAHVQYIYKKTDSALRGNVGAELSAVLKASGERFLPFLPAFPQMNRITRGGIHYIDGVPVTESPFGIDPFEPVRHASVTELIAEQSDVPAGSFPALQSESVLPAQEGIWVFDSESASDLRATGQRLLETGTLHVMAGCAGFGAVLPELLGIGTTQVRPIPTLDERFLVVCGSVNPITRAQLDVAEEAGFYRLRLSPKQKLDVGYWESKEGGEELRRLDDILAAHPRCIIETNDKGSNQPTADYAAALGIGLSDIRVRISGSLGILVGKLFASPCVGTLLVTGGDTLLECMKSLGAHELEPVCEMEKGVVLARFTCNGCTRFVITKSGGFGKPDLMTQLADRIAKSSQS